MPRAATPRAAVDGEALLRERLTPAQLADLDATGGFNVRGDNDQLYRVYADVAVGNCNVHDGQRGRTAYVHDSLVGDPWDGYHSRVDGWPEFNASCIKLMIEVNAAEFERKACDQAPPFAGPDVYSGFYAERGERRLTIGGSLRDPLPQRPEPEPAPTPDHDGPARDSRGRFLPRMGRFTARLRPDATRSPGPLNW